MEPTPKTSTGAMVMRHIAPEDVPAHVRRLDGRVDELWVVEDCFYAGGISQVTAVLANTTESTVGHGIAPAPFRNAAALAMEWATLARLYPGRLACGVGHGVDYWMDQIGETKASPVTLIREVTEATRALLAGETITVDGRYVQLDNVTLEFPPMSPPPVSLGVRGPVSMKTSGAAADGTIVAEGPAPADIATYRSQIDEGRAEAGRSDHHRITSFAGFFIGDPAELPPPPADITPGWAAVGPVDQVTEELQAMVDAGVDSLVLVPFGDPEPQLDLAIEEVLPNLRLGADWRDADSVFEQLAKQ